VAELDVPDGVRGVALVPNRRGLDRALAAGIREVAVVISATRASRTPTSTRASRAHSARHPR